MDPFLRNGFPLLPLYPAAKMTVIIILVTVIIEICVVIIVNILAKYVQNSVSNLSFRIIHFC